MYEEEDEKVRCEKAHSPANSTKGYVREHSTEIERGPLSEREEVEETVKSTESMFASLLLSLSV